MLKTCNALYLWCMMEECWVRKREPLFCLCTEAGKQSASSRALWACCCWYCNRSDWQVTAAVKPQPPMCCKRPTRGTKTYLRIIFSVITYLMRNSSLFLLDVSKCSYSYYCFFTYNTYTLTFLKWFSSHDNSSPFNSVITVFQSYNQSFYQVWM